MPRADHQRIVKQLLDSKAVDFKAIGEMISAHGNEMALYDDPWDIFCGTMRTFIQVYRLPGGINPAELENLADLKRTTKGIQG
jgi:hypothetical protein